MARTNAALALEETHPRPKVRVRVTLGELIAAAYKVLGDDPAGVARLLASREFEQALGRKVELA